MRANRIFAKSVHDVEDCRQLSLGPVTKTQHSRSAPKADLALGIGHSVPVSGESSGAPDPVSPGWYPDPGAIAPLRWGDGGSWTGSVPGTDAALPDVAEFVGGMNVPSQLGGRLNATVPCIRLTIGPDSLRMHSRSLLSAIFSDFEVSLRDIAAAFPLRGTFMTSGIGFELSDGQLAYFWTLGDKDRIFAVLQQRGVPIDLEPRRALGVVSGQFGMLWNGGRAASPSSVAKVPGYSQPMKRLMPLFILLGIAIIAISASSGTPFGWFVAAIGAVSVVRSIAHWRRNRS